LNAGLEARVRAQVEELERLTRLKRFFAPAVAEVLVAGDAADPLRTHRAEVTVLAAALRGFTAFAEAAEPEEVMAVLRDYHAAMGVLVDRSEGTLERFSGDAMTAPNVFRCDGEVWTIAYQGKRFRLRGSRGFVYLATLLGQPGSACRRASSRGSAPIRRHGARARRRRARAVCAPASRATAATCSIPRHGPRTDAGSWS